VRALAAPRPEKASRMSHLGVCSTSAVARSATFAGTSARRRSSSRVASVRATSPSPIVTASTIARSRDATTHGRR